MCCGLFLGEAAVDRGELSLVTHCFEPMEEVPSHEQ